MSDLSALTAGTWNVDPSHSTVGFTARHSRKAGVARPAADRGVDAELGQSVLLQFGFDRRRRVVIGKL